MGYSHGCMAVIQITSSPLEPPTVLRCGPINHFSLTMSQAAQLFWENCSHHIRLIPSRRWQPNLGLSSVCGYPRRLQRLLGWRTFSLLRQPALFGGEPERVMQVWSWGCKAPPWLTDTWHVSLSRARLWLHGEPLVCSVKLRRRW